MSSIVDSLTQACRVAVTRGVTTTDSLWLSPLRTLSTNSERQHSAAVVCVFAENPTALVQPWVAKDIASPIADITTLYHDSVNLVAAAAQLGTATALLVIYQGEDRIREGCMSATLVARTRYLDIPSFRVGALDRMEIINNPRLLYV